MPLINIREIENDCLIGIWHITESLNKTDISFLHHDKYLKSINIESRKMASIAARMLIKQMLAHWKEPYRGLFKNENGEPGLEDCDFKVSLSHSGDYAMAIINKDKKVGIDIELIKEKILRIAHRVFSANEIEMAGEDIEKLTLLWCAKEALYKMYGDKKLSFRDNIFINLLAFNRVGEISGEIKFNEYQQIYKIHFEKFGDYIMAYSYQHI